MPPKNGAKKKAAKKQTYGKPNPKPLAQPNTYQFKRLISDVESISQHNTTYWTVDGNNVGKAFAFSLDSLTQKDDFKNLFKYYRLKGARVRIYFSNTGSVVTGNDTTNPNTQIMVTIDRNMNGETGGVADENNYLQSQTAKRRIALGGDRKPIDIYMPLKQASEVYESGTGTTTLARNVLSAPKWLATENDLVPHFGYNIMMQRVDGRPFSTGTTDVQYCRILTTLYLECKKVE